MAIIGLCAWLFGGCMAMMGLGNFKRLASAEEQMRMAGEWGVPEERSFILDTTYRVVVDTVGPGSYDLRKALWQPLQVRIYDRDGKLVRVVSNCHVGGFPNLRWERSQVFDAIPPPPSRMIDSTITLAGDLRFVEHPERIPPSVLSGEKDYTLVVYWTVMMGRQSERLIRYAKEGQQRWPGKYDVYFIAADNLYFDGEP